MANYVDYIKSISDEIKAIQGRVRHFVKHYGEDGRYKETILIFVKTKATQKRIYRHWLCNECV